MSKTNDSGVPITPLVACDVFVLNSQNKLLLIQRADNKMWALPGGCHDLGETPKECAQRECFEETGLKVSCTRLIGIYSSNCYEYENYPWKENEFAHMLFFAEVKGGIETTSSETLKVAWFGKDEIPELSDGHSIRIEHGWKFIEDSSFQPYFE